MPAELARLSKPHGHWIALPIQAYRINTLFISKKAADQVGVTKLPATWAEFNAIAEKMKAAGITPIANGGIKWDDGMKWEIALCGISLEAYRKALMELDDKTLKGPEVLAAFRQFRKLARLVRSRHRQPGLHHLRPALHEGRDGHAADGRLGAGIYKRGGFQVSDYMVGPAPADDGKIAFDLNSDEFMFWQKQAAGVPGRPEAAGEDRDEQGVRTAVLPDHRLDPGAHRHRPVRLRASTTSSARHRSRWARQHAATAWC